ncbi:MAG: hypothetical protein A3H96_22510 [Acidobacteria bacterium RIFCSPLOWO2_02_FULL_67_36]|nr:MAG: hypothetical protein A3H96_22510 [Acidobacteria bacterium RIFCSPLOWO2_02_FULL_67_36]OFW25729.1 MAG: hypothetical protein A3G21_24540 [Acidobacteria bacterium RIFCSPLOWO2_12_FULL_66_21]
MVSPLDPFAFIGQFVEEARERLRSLDDSLLSLERDPKAGEAMREALRQAHSLKGSAKMLGLNDISRLVHRMEDLLVAAREDRVALDARAFDALFTGVDALTSRVDQLAGGIREPMDVTPFCRAFDALTGSSEGPAVPAEEVEAAMPAAPAQPLVAAPDAGTQAGLPRQAAPEVRRSVRVLVEKIDGLANLAAEMVIQNLQASERAGELRHQESLLRQLKNRLQVIRQGLPSGGNGVGSRLDEYVDLVEGAGRRMRQFVEEFSGDQVRMNLVTEELRQTVIGLTMLPLSTVFDAFPRAVRDLARDFGKEVEFTVRGRETELDKKIIEQINEPLVHLVRNAIDHGIESPADRVRQGKPRQGQLLLSAEQQGNRILITIQDDGRGIDPATLRAAALTRRLVSEEELERWSEEDVLGLIFHPGFSTSRTVTDVSGRGVGMDVVKQTVERLHGAIRIHSQPGRGADVVLDLPLSLALIRALLVEGGGELFALPTTAVERIVYVEPQQIRMLQEGEALEVSGETVPLVSLDRLFQLPPPAGPLLRRPVLVARAFDHRFGIMVDAVHHEQELVFRELRGRLRDHRSFSGATVLGDGRIVLILEVHEIFQLAVRTPAIRASAVRAVAREIQPGLILVVEDSFITGELERNILIAAGYRAELAHDGVHGLEVLRQKKCDLVIADVDMPRMDGFELTSRMRADDRLRDIPVIIVTARESPEDRRRGIEVGADAYVTKSEFNQRQLLETIQRLIGR